MFRGAIVLTLLSLAACTFSSQPFWTDDKMQVESGSAHSVVISPVSTVNDGQARQLAQQYCHQRGRSLGQPRMATRDTLVYECL